jgi:hypothetical protein
VCWDARVDVVGAAADVVAGVLVGRVNVQDVDGARTPSASWACACMARSHVRDAMGEDRGDPARLAALRVLRGEAFQLALAVEVTLNEVDAVVVVDGDVHERDATVDALRLQRTLTGRDAIATQLDNATGGRHERFPLLAWCVQRALEA